MTASPERFTLSSTTLEAQLVPEWGGRVVLLRSRPDAVDLAEPLRGDTFSPVYWPKGGIYPLVPYSNRIRNAHLQFRERSFSLPPHPEASPHTLHGVAQTMPWQVVDHTAHSATLSLHYEGPHWPWRFSAEQYFVVEGNHLHQRLSLTNRSDTAMPAGLGSHPYLQFGPGDTAHFHAERSWTIDRFQIATGESAVLTQATVMRKSAPDDVDIGGYFSEWNGILSLERKEGTVRVSTPDFSHLVLFAPAGLRYLCVEPVSHVADGFNLAALGVPHTGMEILEPGATLERSLSIEWIPRRAT
ncbi:aldose 1-epimerase [Robbsia sp. KACC 23696]|uniref:aldose 1-epimerase n=1 Tax=Robbsia sp. KACC 23696 TaxID=3149231 RepID=UPI00325BB34E